MTKIKITNGRIIDPAYNIDQDGPIFIAGKNIISLFKEPDGFQADIEINARRQIVCPGFIDLSARLREPGETHKATIASETLAAAKSGITSLCIPPDTLPVIDTPAVAELIFDKAERAGYEHIFPIGAMTQQLKGTELSSLHTLQTAGCIAVSNVRNPYANLLILKRAMEYAASHDILFMHCPQEYWLANNGCAHEGAFATHYGLPGIPETAETIALSQCLALLEQTGCRVHFSQLSCAASIALVKQAQRKSLPVSCDVAAHQLFLTEDDMQPFDSAYHVIPPLRSQVDKQALRAGLSSGVINAICSDHQPHDIDAKLGAFPETAAGISAFETLLPLMLKLVNNGALTLPEGIASITCNPAKILKLKLGTLTPDSVANICIFNPTQEWTVNEQSWQSNGKNTPFWNHTMQGSVTYTLQSGRIIYQQQ